MKTITVSIIVFAMATMGCEFVVPTSSYNRAFMPNNLKQGNILIVDTVIDGTPCMSTFHGYVFEPYPIYAPINDSSDFGIYAVDGQIVRAQIYDK